MKNWFESITHGARDARMRDACSVRSVRYLGHGRAPEPHLELEILRPQLNTFWRNVAHAQHEGDDEKWFFDLTTFVDLGIQRLGSQRHGMDKVPLIIDTWPGE